ncbi:M56 family metallopeptidase [Undibacterium sp. TJN25]|uniref:M56 family metallopeptidase n=1 Tax=Undibacterium sp. TJN25 TaxID=3413056 RepID=UPI003BF18ECA
MNAFFQFASALAQVLLHSLWQLALLGLMAALSMALLRKSSAMLRHAAGMLWLLAMLLAPLLTFAWLWQALPVLPAGAPDIYIASGSGYVAAGVANPLADWMLTGASVLWVCGVLCMLVLQAGGWHMIRRLEQQPFLELPAEWQRRTEALRAAFGISRAVAVRLAGNLPSPFTARLWRPVIWLPVTLLTQLPAEQIEALLAHELAHIRRLDWLWNGLQCAIESLLFFHPAMWWLSKRIRQEREHACDDLAVKVCGDPVVLAEALTGLHRHGSAAPRFALAAGGGSLMKRISHLLSGRPARQNWGAPLALAILLCSGVLLASQVEPPRHLLTNLKINSSSSGALTAGNFREFTASYLLDKQRYYRISMDQHGAVTETYTEDGHKLPVDDKVRAWLKELEPMGALPTLAAMPTLPALPALPTLPATPVLPALPTKTGPSDSAELTALFRQLQGDGRLAAALGQPVSMDRSSFHGNVHTWGRWDFHLWGMDEPEGGKAKFTVVFAGPKGRASVGYDGATRNGVWQIATLDIRRLPSP